MKKRERDKHAREKNKGEITQKRDTHTRENKYEKQEGEKNTIKLESHKAKYTNER